MPLGGREIPDVLVRGSMKPPDKLERRDVEAGLERTLFGKGVQNVLRHIDEARLDRLLDENLKEQHRLAADLPSLTGAAYLKHQQRWDVVSRQYNRLMKERFGTPS